MRRLARKEEKKEKKGKKAPQESAKGGGKEEMSKQFRPYNMDKPLELSPNLREWLPPEHLSHFISDVVDSLDLSEIFASYLNHPKGQPPYHPAMLVKLLFYAYCMGKPSSRKIERATYEDVAYRMLAADQHPDHDTIAEFRHRHLAALAGLFIQVLMMCKHAGLVKIGHVSLDGTKVKANASKHKAMSYERMTSTEAKLVQEIDALLAQSEAVDKAEDERFGKGVRGDELPPELARRQSRLAKIQEAKAALEEQAKEAARIKAEEQQDKIQAREDAERTLGKKPLGRAPNPPENPEIAVPEPKAQRNFTDPDSRIMVDGATKGFEQAYNAQIVVDSEAQVIVAAAVTQQTNDKQQLVPMLSKVQENLGSKPKQASADAGYFSEANVTATQLQGIDLYIAVGRQKHEETVEAPSDPLPLGSSVTAAMRYKLKTEDGQAVYRRRKAIVEPVFGQIKAVRGFRRFSFRGLVAVSLEWCLICLTHNLLKLFRYGSCYQAA
jgi:transposase